jgi:hypothetical protein
MSLRRLRLLSKEVQKQSLHHNNEHSAKALALVLVVAVE